MLKFLSVITLMLSFVTSSFANEVKVEEPTESKSYVIGMVGEPHSEQPVEGTVLNR